MEDLKTTISLTVDQRKTDEAERNSKRQVRETQACGKTTGKKKKTKR